MRRSRKLISVGLAAVGALAVSASALAAAGDVIQTLNAQVSPSRLSDASFKGVKLHIDVAGCFEGTDGKCDPNARPAGPDTSRVVFGFDKKDVAFDTTEAARCKTTDDQIAVLNPDQAKQACGRKSVIGKGKAQARAGDTLIPATVTAFNGNKKDQVYLHAYAESANTGTVPVGKLKKGNKLDVQVDPLLSGSARLETFEVDIKKNDYVSARCTNKKIVTTSTWTYRDAPTERVNDTQKCKQA